MEDCCQNKECCHGHKRKEALTSAAFVFGVFLVISAWVVANSFYQVKSLSNVISVTGSAEKIVQADMAKWSASFSRLVPPSQLASGTSLMKKDAQVILDYFKNAGFKDNEITLNPLTMSAVCESQQNIIWDKNGNQNCAGNITGYSLQQKLFVETNEVSKLSEVSKKAVEEIVGKGVIFSSDNFEYFYQKLSELRADLLAEATQNAKIRAEKIAKSTGSNIGKLQNATMGVMQVSAKNSVEVSDYGMYDTQTAEKKITAVVRVSFVLK